jgi:hypothetical protein
LTKRVRSCLGAMSPPGPVSGAGGSTGHAAALTNAEGLRALLEERVLGDLGGLLGAVCGCQRSCVAWFGARGETCATSHTRRRVGGSARSEFGIGGGITGHGVRASRDEWCGMMWYRRGVACAPDRTVKTTHKAWRPAWTFPWWLWAAGH